MIHVAHVMIHVTRAAQGTCPHLHINLQEGHVAGGEVQHGHGGLAGVDGVEVEGVHHIPGHRVDR